MKCIMTVVIPALAVYSGTASAWSPNTPLSSVEYTFVGEEEHDGAGDALGRVGDVNGDGYDDFMIGSPRNDEHGEDAGKLYLFWGRDSGWTLDVDVSEADVIYYGEGEHDNVAPFTAGGDLNNDGFDDILIYSGSGDEKVHVILGKASGWDAEVPISSSDASFVDNGVGHHSLSGAHPTIGDINGDGYDDILLDSNAQEDFDSFGKVYLIFGRETPWQQDMHIGDADAWFWPGNANATLDTASVIGDVNGDGYDDFNMGGDLQYLGERGVLVFGHQGGWGCCTLAADAADAMFVDGYTGRKAGDVNGDGLDDILFVGYGNDEFGDGSGQVWLIMGRTTGWSMAMTMDDMEGASFHGVHDWAAAGKGLDCAGDVNGDGLDDLLIGSPSDSTWGLNTGQSYLFLGRTDQWPVDAPLSEGDASWYGEGIPEQSGSEVAIAGDVNGDGFDDLLISSGDAVSGEYRGRVYLVFGHEEVCTDEDADGYGNPGNEGCWAGTDTDCDDSDPDINPGADEDCTDGIDNDCDGAVDGDDSDCTSDDDDSADDDDDDSTDDDDDSDGDDDEDDDDGCSCSNQEAGSWPAAWLLVPMLAGLAVVRRRS